MNQHPQNPILWMIIPCYNEEEVLPLTAPLFMEQLQKMIKEGRIHSDSKILFIDDGSTDATWNIICLLARQDNHFIGIRQSRNRGHQNAVLAGLMEAKTRADITISIDCDGQDDIHAMDEMVSHWMNGSEIVYGVRSSRQSDTWFKRNSAQLYYKVMKKMGVDLIYNHADYRLVSAEVLKNFADFEEVNLFLRGLFPLIGFESSTVPYERHSRIRGKSHYPLKKMTALAFDGITSLSTQPIHFISIIGILISIVGFGGMIWALWEALTGQTVPGWASLVCIICLLEGIQLLSLGIIGEYIGKTYLETKHRPRYIISDRTWTDHYE